MRLGVAWGAMEEGRPGSDCLMGMDRVLFGDDENVSGGETQNGWWLHSICWVY
jgi:hypothetical protein